MGRNTKENFLLSTKKLRFEQEKGLCQWCFKPIETFQKAHFHHKTPIYSGGTKDPANCTVLHRKCHFDPIIFEKLHGFPFKSQIWYKTKKQLELF